MSDHLILAYTLDGTGLGEVLTEPQLEQSATAHKTTWIHLDAQHPESRNWLSSQVNPVICEALLAEETRPRMIRLDGGILLILRGVNLNEQSDPEDMVSIRLWMDSHQIISLRRRRIKAVGDIESLLKNGEGPKNTGDFLCMLIAQLFGRIEPVLSNLDESTDEIEERILERADTQLRESIVSVRKKAILLRRYMAPQRDAISQLFAERVDWLTEEHRRQIQEAFNSVTRYVEDLDAIRERAQIVKDELANILADKLNRNMYVLSVIAAIFLPLGFLTGLLGINVGGIPGTESQSAFWLVCLVMTILVAAQVAIFKRLKWF